ncbi:MAG TPA: cupin domain-containing protein [Anaerolineaceae bacterium]
MKFIADASQETPVQMSEGVQRRVLAYGGSLMIGQFTFAAGAVAAWHSHLHEQVSYIVSGEIDYYTENAEPVRLKAGCSFYVPSNLKHRVVAIVPTVIVDAFTPQREEFLR